LAAAGFIPFVKMPAGSQLTPHRRWALDCLVEAIKEGSYGVADVIDKRDGKLRHMLGRVVGSEGNNVKFIPLALLMDNKILEDYTHDVEHKIVIA
jgi:hypothetical protein